MAKVIFASLLVILLVALASAQQEYCSLQSCRGKLHTMCRFKSTWPSQQCGKVIANGLSQDEKHRLVKAHNHLRQKVASGQERQGSNGPQPRARNMANLEWDTELEQIAQRWANQCNFAHDQCRDVGRYNVGQNIAIRWTTGNINTYTVENFVQSWYDEVKYFNRNEVSNLSNLAGANNKVVGHYTQLVWAKTTKVGCGAVKYVDQQRNMNSFYLVCNYGPAGNFFGEPIYQV